MKNLFLYASVLFLSVLTSCKNTDKAGTVEDTKQATIDSMKIVAEKQRIIDSMKNEVTKIEKQKEIVVVNNSATPSTTNTATSKRKGWSGAAKGAVIGAGVGAITGAAISKKKGEGAIIGGLAGAGVGAGTGAIIDGKKK